MQFRCRACDRMVETPPGWTGDDFACPLCGRPAKTGPAIGSEGSGPGAPARGGPAGRGQRQLVVGTTLCAIGLLMVLQSIHLAFAKYDLGSVRDASTWGGGMGVSLLICAVGAWLMRRGAARRGSAEPARRPRLRVPVVIILGIGVAYGLMLLAGAWMKRASHSTASGVARERFSGRGVAFDLPDGWMRMKPDKEKLLAWVVSPGSDPRRPEAMIMVETGKPRTPDLAESADGYAAMWGAKVLEEPIDLAGVPARRVRGKNPTPEMRPVEAVVAIRRGQLYLIMGGVTSGHSCAKEVEVVRRSWKWMD